MNKKVLVIAAIVLGLVVIGGGIIYANNQNDKNEQEKMAMEKKTEEEAMMKKEESAAMEKDAMAKEDAMSKQGSYVTLAEYNSNPSKYSDSKKVYFFHASWCPICQGIDKEITADTSSIPAGVTLIKTDFDTSTELRQKYGVTTQYTFVQVDASGNETAQWSATSVDDAIAGIQS
jgi:thiol-disulfide isomerase/thioredoxin